MALYRHVDGRDELVAAVVHQVIDDLFSDTLMSAEPSSWGDHIQHVANAPRSLRWVDHFPASLLDIAWLSAAMGVVAGALGSSFDSDADLKSLTHAQRMRTRVYSEDESD